MAKTVEMSEISTIMWNMWNNNNWIVEKEQNMENIEKMKKNGEKQNIRQKKGEMTSRIWNKRINNKILLQKRTNTLYIEN